MKTNTIGNIVATARGTDVLLPILTGQQTLGEWAASLAKESVVTKNGREISAARHALGGAQFAMTNVAMALRSATELGALPWTTAVHETKRIYNLLDGLRVAFAGVRNEAHRELVIAEVTLDVKDGAFDDLQSQTDDEPYGEEELLDMGLGWEAIQEFLAAQAHRISLGQSHLMDSVGSMSEDEGAFRTSVHDANQLWDMELASIKWAEFSAAPVALIGMDWPTSHPMWASLQDRLALSWEAGIEYADDKEAAAKKVERRAGALDDLHAKPAYARWAINHVTRRVFRDMEVLTAKGEEIQARWDAVEKRAFNEERYNVPSSLTRPALGENGDNARKAFLLYTEMNEGDLGCNSAYAAMDTDGITLRGTMKGGKAVGHSDDGWTTLMEADTENVDSILDADRRWFQAQLDEVGRLLLNLKGLHIKLRAMDVQLAKLWEIFARDGMPTSPPLYWGKNAFYHDAAEARAAIRVEMAEAKAQARLAEGDALVKAAAMVAEMLGL